MSEEEKQQFEDRIQEDQGFREIVHHYLQAMQTLGRGVIRTKVAEAYLLEAREQQKLRFRQYSLAASVLVLCVVGLFLIIPRGLDLPGLFEEYYEFKKVETRSVMPTLDSMWNTALDFYEGKEIQDFTRAANEFESLLENPDFDVRHHSEANLYLGLSYLELDRPLEAIQALKKVSEYSIRYYPAAVWYTGLAFLQADDLEQARKAFSEMRHDGRWSKNQREKAAKICETIECEPTNSESL